MPALIETLLDSPDNFERVRDQIAQILKLEIVHQGTLGLSPVPRVFLERASPWAIEPDGAPIVNVWFDTGSFDGAASNISSRQRFDATFNVDVYAFAVSAETVDGHAPGDEAAALACEATLRLVRQILMSEHYTYLGMRGVVWKRWPQTLGMFQPPADARPAEHVVAGRFALAVQFNEFAPQVEGQPIESLLVEVRRAETGEIYSIAEYPSPPPSP